MTDRVAHYAGWRVVNMVQVPYAPTAVQTESLLYEFIEGRTNIPMLVCSAYYNGISSPPVIDGYEAYALYPGRFSHQYDIGTNLSGDPTLAFGYYDRAFIAETLDIVMTNMTKKTWISKWDGSSGVKAVALGGPSSVVIDVLSSALAAGLGTRGMRYFNSSVSDPGVMAFLTNSNDGNLEYYAANSANAVLNDAIQETLSTDILSGDYSNITVGGINYTYGPDNAGARVMIIWTPETFSIPDGTFSSIRYGVSVDDENAQYIIDNKDLVITSKWGWIFCGKLAGEDRARFIMVNYDWTKCWRIAPVGGDVYATELLARVAAGLNGASMAQDELGNFHLVERTSSSGAAFPPNIIWAGYSAPPGSEPPEDNETAEEPAWEGDVPTTEALPFIEAQPSVDVNPDMNRLRAWTFTLDGHDYYVLRLGEDVTLVYDTITRQWSEWATADWDVWRVNVGLNWGSQDIVAGDLAEGQLWNIDPVARLDDITIPITTVVTGGLPMRGLDSVPCGVMLTGSLGEPAADSEGIGVRLETSDDNGKTFTDHGQVPLLTGENYQPTWLSIGQISAPGRVFKFTDVGGMARVDGADNLDG